LIGATNPLKADIGTIRGDYGVNQTRNLVHASDSPEAAQIEIARFFGK
jgi:nucleoside-diphosphate kinase